MSRTMTNPDEDPLARGGSKAWTIAASASSIVSALLASLCCIGPLVFALLGIGGAGMLVKFEPYRPYFMMVTFALLGVGFHSTYRRPKRAIANGPTCACAVPGAQRAGKIMLWLATILVAIFLAFPYVAAWIWG